LFPLVMQGQLSLAVRVILFCQPNNKAFKMQYKKTVMKITVFFFGLI